MGHLWHSRDLPEESGCYILEIAVVRAIAASKDSHGCGHCPVRGGGIKPLQLKSTQTTTALL